MQRNRVIERVVVVVGDLIFHSLIPSLHHSGLIIALRIVQLTTRQLEITTSWLEEMGTFSRKMVAFSEKMDTS